MSWPYCDTCGSADSTSHPDDCPNSPVAIAAATAHADSTSPTGYRCSCGAELSYIADYGAPGIGQHWQCKLGHDWSLVGGTFSDPRSGAHILTPEQTR